MPGNVFFQLHWEPTWCDLFFFGGVIAAVCFISSVDVMVKAATGACLAVISSSKHECNMLNEQVDTRFANVFGGSISETTSDRTLAPSPAIEQSERSLAGCIVSRLHGGLPLGEARDRSRAARRC